MNNSPYVIIKGRQYMQLVREGRNNELGYFHNGSISMKKTLKRPDFVKN